MRRKPVPHIDTGRELEPCSVTHTLLFEAGGLGGQTLLYCSHISSAGRHTLAQDVHTDLSSTILGLDRGGVEQGAIGLATQPQLPTSELEGSAAAAEECARCQTWLIGCLPSADKAHH